jgi:hypothetical protein
MNMYIYKGHMSNSFITYCHDFSDQIQGMDWWLDLFDSYKPAC